MARPTKATPVIKGKAAQRILDEMREGTPDTPQRIETIRRADRVFKRSVAKRHGERPTAR